MLDWHEILAFSSCLLLAASPHVTKPWVHFFHQSDPKDCMAHGNDFVSAQLLLDIREFLPANWPNPGKTSTLSCMEETQIQGQIGYSFSTTCRSLAIFSQVWSSGWQILEKKWKGLDGRSYMARERNVAGKLMNWWKEQASDQKVK